MRHYLHRHPYLGNAQQTQFFIHISNINCYDDGQKNVENHPNRVSCTTLLGNLLAQSEGSFYASTFPSGMIASILRIQWNINA